MLYKSKFATLSCQINNQSINYDILQYRSISAQISSNQIKSITENAHEITEKRTTPTQNKTKQKKNKNKERNPPKLSLYVLYKLKSCSH